MKVVFREAARADIAAIHEFISRDNPRVARQVVALIEQAIRRLSRFPNSGRVGAIDGTRELVVSRLPYIVVYRVAKDAADILAVFHAGRNRPRA
jgi:addiction module RelE/StbE family toxin